MSDGRDAQRERETTDEPNAAHSNNNTDQTLNRTHVAAALSFMRLAIVERQLIMQGLDFTPLSRLASTCRQLRGEALHKAAAGKSLSRSVDAAFWLDSTHPAHASPLYRMHVPTTFALHSDAHYGAAGSSAAHHQALIAKAAGFARIIGMSVEPQSPWDEARIMHLLAQPFMRSVTSVSLSVSAWPLTAAVQHAFFSLPELCSLSLHLAKVPNVELLDSAVCLALKLRSVGVAVGIADPTPIRALHAAPNLTHLSLESVESDIPLGPLLCGLCRMPTLTKLSLCNFTLEPASLESLQSMFVRLPMLGHFEANEMRMAPLLQALVDAGPVVLSHLHRVELEEGQADGLLDLVPMFLSAFTSASLHLFPEQRRTADRQCARQLVRSFRGWARVNFDPSTVHLADNESDGDDNSDIDQ